MRQIKQKNGVILCYRESEDSFAFIPSADNVVFNDLIPWEDTSEKVVRLNDASLVFESDPRVFADLKTRKLDELRISFDDRISGAFKTSQNYSMQFDTSDALKMQGAIQLLEASGETKGYLTQANDETVYNVPLETMKAVLIEMMTAFAACHARKQELRAAIKAAETVEDLNAIEITWPV